MPEEGQKDREGEEKDPKAALEEQKLKFQSERENVVALLIQNQQDQSGIFNPANCKSIIKIKFKSRVVVPIRQAGIDYKNQTDILQAANLALVDQLQVLEAQNKEFMRSV